MSAGEPTSTNEDPPKDLTPPMSKRRPAVPSLRPPYPVQNLSSAPRFGVMGDLHGDLEHALQAFQTFADRGVTCITQLGDWGIIWPRRNWQIDLHKLSRGLARHHMSLYFVDGNHDWLPKILTFPVDPDGVRWVAGNVGYLPRGYRARISEHFTLAALGGANSIDREPREEDVSWWPDEQITDADLWHLSGRHADVLVGNEVPLRDLSDQQRQAHEPGFSPEDSAYAAQSWALFRRAVMLTRPQLTLGGHYHRFYDLLMALPGPKREQTRVVVLDMNGKGRVNLAILDTVTLELEFLYRNGDPAEPETMHQKGLTMTDPQAEPTRVNELTGEEGGVWRVVTRDSTHYVDLDRFTVTRVPGVHAPPTINDRTRPLRTIDTLRVGARGRWTMFTDGPDEEIDFFWADTSLVTAIVEISRDEAPGAGGVVAN